MKSNFEILLEEANYNYNASRFPDAAATYEHLIHLCLQDNRSDDAIYFAYRSAGAWRKANREDRIAAVYHRLGLTALKISVNEALNAAKSSDDDELRINSFTVAAKAYGALDHVKDEKEMWEKVVKLHIDKADEKKTELSVKRIHLKKAINILNDRNESEQVKTVTEKLADVCIKIGEKQLTMGGLDIEVIAALEFRQAADLMESIDGSEDKITELRAKADKLEK